jgi:predicted nucleotidyltransferase
MATTDIFSSARHVTAEIDRAVALFGATVGVRRVWFFGSLAGHEGRPDSDLDFAAEGLPKEAHFATLGELMLVLHAPVDLVRWEEAGDALRAEILRRGTVVYAA